MSDEKRPYKKKNMEYWDNLSKKSSAPTTKAQATAPNPLMIAGIQPVEADQEWISAASCRTNSTTTSKTRGNIKHFGTSNKYANIQAMMLPYESSADGYDIADAVELCQRAYANVAVFRNAIEFLAEYSNGPVALEGGSKQAREFGYDWLEKIDIDDTLDQTFLETYRSSNVFLVEEKFRFNEVQSARMREKYGIKGAEVKSIELPINYLMLNPHNLIALHDSNYSRNAYGQKISTAQAKMMSLKNPKIKELLDKKGQTAGSIVVPFEDKDLVKIFLNKQDYEPFATPFGFPVLDDIDFKLELKAIDRAVLRSIENAILLVTTGDKELGVNPQNLVALQNIFKSERPGRVLVADYSTKVEFVIPDINKVIGSDKYQVVDNDIREGLQLLFTSQEKYGNVSVKVTLLIKKLNKQRLKVQKIFDKKLREACEKMGFAKEDVPQFRIKPIDLNDSTNLNRLATRLIELNVLTPEEGIRFMEEGLLPESHKIEEDQEKFMEQRERGLHNPLVGGVPVGPNAVSAPSGSPSTNMKSGRPKGGPTSSAKAKYDPNTLLAVTQKTEALERFARGSFKEQYKLEELDDNQKSLITKMVQSVVISSDEEGWNDSVSKCVKDFNTIMGLDVKPEIVAIASEKGVEDYEAALIYHATKLFKDKNED